MQWSGGEKGIKNKNKLTSNFYNHISCVYTTIFISIIMIKCFQALPTVGGQPSQEGFAALYVFTKGVIPMTILDVVAVIGVVLTALQIGFSFGKSAKK